jgi:Fur family ferric uptake transcriptional regulator
MDADKYLIDAIRSQGRRLTRQRQLVLEILQDSSEHLDADAVYELAKSRGLKVSLATIYRSLSLLKDLGLVEEHRFGEDHGHFETTQDGPHAHFTCLRCGRVVELEAPKIITAARAHGERAGFRVVEVTLHLSGYCDECQNEMREEQP